MWVEDEAVLSRALEHGLDQTIPAPVDIIIDVRAPLEVVAIQEALQAAGYGTSLAEEEPPSIYATREFCPTLENVIAERERVRSLLAAFDVNVEDWGLMTGVGTDA